MRIILYLLFLLVMASITNAQKVETYNVKSQPYPEIYIVGEIKKPSKLFFDGSIKLSQAIEKAGGMRLSEKKAKAVIFRRPANCQFETIITIDLQDISTDKNSDIFLQPLDVVSIEEKKPKYKKYYSPRPCEEKKEEKKPEKSVIYGL